MADKPLWHARLVTPEGVQFDGDVEMLVVTGTGGNLGMFARHAPIVADLKMGHCKAVLEDGAERVWATADGFASAHDSEGLVVVEEAIEVVDIKLDEVDQMIAHHTNRIETAAQGEHDIYTSDRGAAEKAIAWGQHLKSMHDEHVAGSSAGH
jgi:F-type H+-transporting ATPase subunit epsilon